MSLSTDKISALQEIVENSLYIPEYADSYAFVCTFCERIVIETNGCINDQRCVLCKQHICLSCLNSKKDFFAKYIADIDITAEEREKLKHFLLQLTEEQELDPDFGENQICQSCFHKCFPKKDFKYAY